MTRIWPSLVWEGLRAVDVTPEAVFGVDVIVCLGFSNKNEIQVSRLKGASGNSKAGIPAVPNVVGADVEARRMGCCWLGNGGRWGLKERVMANLNRVGKSEWLWHVNSQNGQ